MVTSGEGWRGGIVREFGIDIYTLLYLYIYYYFLKNFILFTLAAPGLLVAACMWDLVP